MERAGGAAVQRRSGAAAQGCSGAGARCSLRVGVVLRVGLKATHLRQRLYFFCFLKNDTHAENLHELSSHLALFT